MAEQTTTPTALDTLLSGSKPLFGGNGLAYEVRPELVVLDEDLSGSYDNTSNTLTLTAVTSPTRIIVDEDSGRRVESLIAVAFNPSEYNARTYAKSGTATYVGYSAIRAIVNDGASLKLLNTGALNGDRLELHVICASDVLFELFDHANALIAQVNPGETFSFTLRYVAADPGWYLWSKINMTVGS